MTLTVGSLFSGIGGLDLGLERAGMSVIWQSEIDPYASKVLKKHWPEVINYGDIKKIKWADVVRPDILCGGYPCQPFSTAGKRRGTDDPRHLWPWVRQAISELRPDYVILENVRGHVTLGLSTVLGEMASLGYDAEWNIISASSVGAPHRRDRVIIVAYPEKQYRYGQSNNVGNSEQPEAVSEFGNGSRSSIIPNNDSADTVGKLANANDVGHVYGQFNIVTTTNGNQSQLDTCSSSPNVANPTNQSSDEQKHGNNIRTLKQRQEIQQQARGSSSPMANTDGTPGQQQHQRQISEPDIKRRGDGGKWWETEPDVGRVANGVSSRVDRLKCLGNAVVPQVAELVGLLVIQHMERVAND